MVFWVFSFFSCCYSYPSFLFVFDEETKIIYFIFFKYIVFDEGLRMAPGNEELKREYTQTLILEKQQEEPSIDVYIEMRDEIKNQFLPQTVIFVILKSPSLKMPLAATKKAN